VRPAPKNLTAEPPYPGLATVVFALRFPDWTYHAASARCRREEPHEILECGEWRRQDERAGK